MSRAVLAALLLWASAAATVAGIASGGVGRAVVAVALVGLPVLGTWLVVARRVLVHDVVVLGVVVLAGAAVAAWRVVPLVAGDLAAPAESHAVVTAEVVTTDDPQARDGRAQGSRRTDDALVVDGDLRQAVVAGALLDVDLPVRVLATGDAAAPLAGALPGTRLRLTGHLLPADPRYGRAATVVADRLAMVEETDVVQRAAGAVRESLRRSVSGRSSDVRGLLPGLVVGDATQQSPELEQAMRDSGLAHLTAVSGGNVAVVVALVVVLGRLVGVRRGRAQLVLVALAVASYVVVARPQPSVLRAAAMAAVVLAVLALDLRVRSLDVLAVAVGGLLLLDPFLSLSVGFAMSVGATCALLLVARAVVAGLDVGPWWRRARRAVLGLVVVSAAAQVAVAPLVAGIGGGVPLGGLPANLLAAPAVAPATSLGLVAAALGLVAPSAAAVVALPAGWAVSWIAVVARTTSTWAGTLPWPDGWAGGLALTVVLGLGGVGALLLRRHAPPAVQRAAAAAAALLLLVVAGPLPVSGVTAWAPSGWRIVMCDVGQGDATVLRAADGEAVVVDAGPDPVLVDRCLRRLGVTRVPLVVLTHFHADHVEGLPGVLRGRSVGTVVTSPLPDPPGEDVRVLRWLQDAGAAVRVAAPGDTWTVGDVALRVVWPSRLLLGQGSDPNNASVTMLGAVGGVTVSLGGDLETAAQDAVLALGGVPRVDVVKVPHHGSRHQSVRWASAFAPRIALIGVGEGNDYGHPAPDTLAEYAAVGAVVGRTDLDGDLAVVVGEDGVPQLLRRGRGLLG